MKTHGIKIKAVKVTRYQVTDVLGKAIKTFATRSAAAAWVAGYVAASDRAQRAANAGVSRLVDKATAKRRQQQDDDQ